MYYLPGCHLSPDAWFKTLDLISYTDWMAATLKSDKTNSRRWMSPTRNQEKHAHEREQSTSTFLHLNRSLWNHTWGCNTHSFPCLEGRKISEWKREEEQVRIDILYSDLWAVYDISLWARSRETKRICLVNVLAGGWEDSERSDTSRHTSAISQITVWLFPQ